MTPLEETLVRAARDAGQPALDCACALGLLIADVEAIYAEPRSAPAPAPALVRRRDDGGLGLITSTLGQRLRRAGRPPVDGPRGPARGRVG